jgi:hypothetical protein
MGLSTWAVFIQATHFFKLFIMNYKKCLSFYIHPYKELDFYIYVNVDFQQNVGSNGAN